MEDEIEKMKKVIRKEIQDQVESGKKELSTRKLRERVERLVRREVERQRPEAILRFVIWYVIIRKS